MTITPDHDRMRELLPDAALGLLEADDLRQVLAHTTSCEPCARELLEHQAVVGGLALLAPAAGLLDGDRKGRLRARLMDRVRDGARERHEPASLPWYRRAYMGLAVAAGLAGILVVHHSVHRPVDYGWLAAGGLALVLAGVLAYASVQRARVASLRRKLDERD